MILVMQNLLIPLLTQVTLIFVSFDTAGCFSPTSFHVRYQNPRIISNINAELSENEDILDTSSSSQSTDSLVPARGKKRTINERLLEDVEIQMKETNSPNSVAGKMGIYSRTKTEEERLASLREARDLNGLNPTEVIISSFFALGIAFAIWSFTTFIAEVFATNPIKTDVYFLMRVQSVFRNLVMGFFSLMSGFFGVNGIGILFLGIQVAVGVWKGELDPTPKVKKGKEDSIPDVWQFMTFNKRNKRASKEKNPFF